MTALRAFLACFGLDLPLLIAAVKDFISKPPPWTQFQLELSFLSQHRRKRK
jgi:hypothetical protein